MTTAAELYVRGVRRKLKQYWATWLPTERVSLGDVGAIVDGYFYRHLFPQKDELGLAIGVVTDSVPKPLDYVSSSGVTISIRGAVPAGAAVQPAISAEADASIECSSEGAFVIKAPASYVSSVNNLLALERDLVEAYRQNRWNGKWVMVTKVVTAPTATIIVSKSAKSSIEFSAAGHLAQAIDLGSASAKLSVRKQSGEMFIAAGAADVTPLFQAVRLRWPHLAPHLAGEAEPRKTDPFDLVTPAMRRDKAFLDGLVLDLAVFGTPSRRNEPASKPSHDG